MTIEFHPATDYQACVDPLHRSTWPVRIDGGGDAVIGYLTEHTTVTFDRDAPPVTHWTWKFSDAEANELQVDEDLRASRGHYRSWQGALRTFASMHQLAAALRQAEAHLTAERARKGE